MDFLFFKMETSMMQRATTSIKMALIAKVGDTMNRESTSCHP
jgi:hypothetical protein